MTESLRLTCLGLMLCACSGPGEAADDEATVGADAATPTPTNDCASARVSVAAGETLNVRAQPNTNGEPIGKLPNGAIVRVLERTQGQSIQGDAEWLEIQSAAASGYIASAFAECSPDPAPVVDNDGAFYLPLACGSEASISQGNGGTTSHSGRSYFAYDFRIGIGTPLVAMADGIVIETFEETGPGDPCYGGGPSSCFPFANYVALAHADGTASIYKHLSRVDVPVGATVVRGQTLGLSGSTGYSTGPHAHVMRQEQCSEALKCESVELRFADHPSEVPAQNETVVSGNCQ